jgi:hypothetical protein
MMCLVVVLLGLLSAAYRLLDRPAFDLVKWQQADTTSEYRDRRAMVPQVDLMIEQGTISNRASALHFLGRPQRGDVATGKSWLYNLGGSRTAESAPESITWLMISFDSAGNITRHRMVQEEPMDVPEGGA